MYDARVFRYGLTEEPDAPGRWCVTIDGSPLFRNCTLQGAIALACGSAESDAEEVAAAVVSWAAGLREAAAAVCSASEAADPLAAAMLADLTAAVEETHPLSRLFAELVLAALRVDPTDPQSAASVRECAQSCVAWDRSHVKHLTRLPGKKVDTSGDAGLDSPLDSRKPRRP